MTKKLDAIWLYAVLSIMLISQLLFVRYFDSYFHISFLDVGQGDGILIRSTNDHYMLIDCGPDEKVVESILSGSFDLVSRIDVVVLTHPDKDHYGGLEYVLERFEVGRILVSSYFNSSGVLDEIIPADYLPNVSSISASDRIWLDEDIGINILWPVPFYEPRDDNDASIVLEVNYYEHSFLLTADVDHNILHSVFWLNTIGADRFTIVKAPHHGSKYGLSDDNLEDIGNAIIILSAGKGNRYGHPSTEVISLLNDENYSYFRTDEAGTIEFICDIHICKVVE